MLYSTYPILRRIVAEAYSHEVVSFGWWPGAGPLGMPAYYADAVPEPAGTPQAAVNPAEAYYALDLGEFILPYDSAAPAPMLLDFLQSTYSAAADLAGWDRAQLERPSQC